MTDVDHLKRLAWLVADPDQVDAIRAEDIPDIIGVLESVKTRLFGRLMASSLPQMEPSPSKAEDRLLDATEAAERIGVKRKWMYDHFDTLPFGKRLADRTLRFSERGLERWLERKAS